MLSQRALDNALMAAQAKVNVCRRWCSVGIEKEEATVRVWHNGVGSDSDDQRIYDSKRLALSEDALASLLAEWLTRLHRHQVPAVDLNAEGIV